MSDLEAFARSRIGTSLRGKYTLEKLLGVGGMAAVYQATHRVGNRVAVKILHPHMSINADVRARFLREGYVANQVEHRGAVRVLDDDTAEDGSVFLAMELCVGETLDAYWRSRGERLPAREVAELAHQLLDVLAAAHGKGIVHRDIKPENLFLTDGGILKVLDFGIARLAGAVAPQGATRTGRMLGSPAFMAPEQALGLQRNIDGRTDLWSAGATIFTLISGRFVHEAETVEMMLVHAGSQQARSLAAVAREVPAAIVAVVDRALAFDKAQRWGSAKAMQEGLETAYLGAFGAPIPGAKRDRPRLVLGVTQHEPSMPAGSAPSLPPTFDATRLQAPIVQAVAQTADERTEIMTRRPTAASTTAGIEPDRQERLTGPLGSRRAFGVLVAGGSVVVAVLVGGLVLLRAGAARDNHTMASAAAAPGTPSVSASAGIVASAAASSAAPSASLAPPTVSFSALPPATPAPPRPVSQGTARGMAPGIAATRPATPPPPAPAPSCHAVAYYDDQGGQHFREECH